MEFPFGVILNFLIIGIGIASVVSKNKKKNEANRRNSGQTRGAGLKKRPSSQKKSIVDEFFDGINAMVNELEQSVNPNKSDIRDISGQRQNNRQTRSSGQRLDNRKNNAAQNSRQTQKTNAQNQRKAREQSINEIGQDKSSSFPNQQVPIDAVPIEQIDEYKISKRKKDRRAALRKGIIYSEVIGKPKSLR